MVGNININYSVWTNKRAAKLAKKADKDGVNGLQGEEITNFVRSSVDHNIKKAEIYDLMGLTVSRTRSASAYDASKNDAEFNKAVDFYNENMDSYQRYSVTSKTYDNLQTRLYNMEKAIDKAYMDCEAYSDIMIVPRWHYRYYPLFDDRLLNFDIEDLRERTTKDMEALHRLNDTVTSIIEEANGATEHKEPQKTHYDVDEIAKKHLGMSYAEFAEKYKEELEYCKHVSYADFKLMDEVQAEVYGRAKAYAKEMLEITVNEAHTVNWNVGERKLDETLKASGDMYTISDFEYEGITEQGLSEIKSGIMFQAFKEALMDKYNELKPADEPKGGDDQGKDDGKDDGKKDDTGTSITATEEQTLPKKPVKCIINGAVVVINPDGTMYNLNGQKIK